jgi:hypothetical protein
VQRRLGRVAAEDLMLERPNVHAPLGQGWNRQADGDRGGVEQSSSVHLVDFLIK